MNRTRREYVPYEKSVVVTEIKSTTDESIRLAIEMEEKIMKSILKKISISNNVINFSAIKIENRFMDKQVYHILFRLNGKEFYMQILIDVMHLILAMKEVIVEDTF